MKKEYKIKEVFNENAKTIQEKLQNPILQRSFKKIPDILKKRNREKLKIKKRIKFKKEYVRRTEEKKKNKKDRNTKN